MRIVIAAGITLTTVLSQTRASPVLLATVGGRSGGGINYVISEPRWPGLYYQQELGRVEIFEEFQLTGVYPVTLTQVVSAENDPDFERFAGLLTDGVDEYLLQGWWRETGPASGGGGQVESASLYFDVPQLGPDLVGYDIERVVRHVAVNVETPGRDPFGDGQWTDWEVDGVYEFYGSPVPEPATWMLLVLGSVALLRRRR